MTHAPKHRWFRFSLRTLFVLITALALWLGWEMKSIRALEGIPRLRSSPNRGHVL